MEKLMRVMNKFPMLLLRSPLHGLMSKSVLLITFTGRKSGKTYTTPINYIRQGDTVIMTTDSPWWKNLRGGAPVTLRIEGQEFTGFGEATTGKEEVTQALEAMLRRFPRYGKYANVSLGPEGRINRAQAARAVENGRVLIRVRPDPPAPSSKKEDLLWLE